MSSKLVSICIPAYEMYGHGLNYLTELLNSIYSQTYESIEIVISDHSKDDEIQNFVTTSASNFDIIYLKNERGRGNSSINMNEAIRASSGEIIKMMHQDDWFNFDGAIQTIVEEMEKHSKSWGAINFDHCRNGKMDSRVFSQVGCPSTMFFINDENYFNEELININDGDLTERLKRKYGPPLQAAQNCVTIRMHPNQVSNKLITPEIATRERKYFNETYR